VNATPLVGGLLHAVLVCIIAQITIESANINAPGSTIKVGIKAALNVPSGTPASCRYYVINIKLRG
jgi:hypothetical protein